MKINIVYWSGTGNTKAMAELIEKGARGAGAEVVLKSVDIADPEDAASCDILVLGCPSMGDEELEEQEFAPFMNAIEQYIRGKNIALFGSYGWGDGGWMREWEERVKTLGANLAAASLIVNEAPEGADAKACEEFGRALAGS